MAPPSDGQVGPSGLARLDDPALDGKLRQLRRVLMSYVDIHQAARALGYALRAGLHDKSVEERYILLPALSLAAIIAYCRPFLSNETGDGATTSALSPRFLRGFDAEERALHERLLNIRHTSLAHSDADAWKMEPVVLRLGGKEVVLPLHNDAHAPLTAEAMTMLGKMCGKLQGALLEERDVLEKELLPFLPDAVFDGEELERLRQRYRSSGRGDN